MKLKERDIRRQIQDYLRLTGWFVYYNLAGLGCYPGLSDLVAVKGGRIVHVEVKTPKGRQSGRQKVFQSHLAEYNFNAWRDTNKNKPGFAKAMQRLGQEASL